MASTPLQSFFISILNDGKRAIKSNDRAVSYTYESRFHLSLGWWDVARWNIGWNTGWNTRGNNEGIGTEEVTRKFWPIKDFSD